MGEWNQEKVERRDLETMRRIAQDALEFGDDAGAFERYAIEHLLTVNGIVYYLNAYEYGRDEGLLTIRAPDIIPPDTALHGNITRTKCFEEGDLIDSWPETDEVPPRCPRCGGLLRPDVVWFGETLPHQALTTASQATEKYDVFFSIC